MSIFQKNAVLSDLFTAHAAALSAAEGLTPDFMHREIEAGRMLLLGNPAHQGLRPLLIGQPGRVKINANIGVSPLCSDLREELRKLAAALEAGADTLMDLSIAGDLPAIRRAMLRDCPLPLGTVPLYAVAQRYIEKGQDPALISPEEIFAEIESQAEQGVDFMTVHYGITERAAALADGRRVMGIVSRGGSILARWMKRHKKENPLLTGYRRILEIARERNVTLSLGDGLRPGAGADAGDVPQWEEVAMLGRLAAEGLDFGVQCMIEGPGHVPMQEVDSQIRAIKAACHNAPLYVLGPLTMDSSPGYDHIAGAIGAALAVRAGADFICYLTPAEHLALPGLEDVRAGVLASRVAVQAGEISLGRPWALAREQKISTARKKLDWPAMQEAALDPAAVCARRRGQENVEACAMCGDFCAVKMLR